VAAPLSPRPRSRAVTKHWQNHAPAVLGAVGGSRVRGTPATPPTTPQREQRRDAFAAHAAAAATARAHKRAYINRLAGVDASVLAMAVLIGYAARFQGVALGSRTPYLPVGLGLVAAWMLTLAGMRCYDDRILGYGTDEYRRVVSSSLKLAGAVAIVGYLAGVQISRGFLGVSFAAGTALLPIGRYLVRKSLHRARSRERGWARRVLVVGDPSPVRELTGQLSREWYAGYQVVGVCLPDALIAAGPQHLDGVPVVGSFHTILEAAAATCADTVAVTGSGELTAERLRRLGWQMEGTGIDLVLAPALTDVAGPRIHTRPVGGLPLIHVESPAFTGGRKLLKAMFDRTFALAGIVLSAPLLAAISLAILIESRGPILMRQVRVGLGGREFTMLTFRSTPTTSGSGDIRETTSPARTGDIDRDRRSARLTRVGAVLRAWSLDKLPQLFTVLTGDMSMVGPRAPLPTEVAWYDQDVARRLLVKPGVTGLWQVSGQPDLAWEDGIRLDLYYVENWSLATDLATLWKALGGVLGRRRAEAPA
jgi:exopolysaccharide biosynthesis polyprenyl glycosylphosphotransferase